MTNLQAEIERLRSELERVGKCLAEVLAAEVMSQAAETRIAAARADEREACARIVEEMAQVYAGTMPGVFIAIREALHDIRARGWK